VWSSFRLQLLAVSKSVLSQHKRKRPIEFASRLEMSDMVKTSLTEFNTCVLIDGELLSVIP
jgi:hypothetical protein